MDTQLLVEFATASTRLIDQLSAPGGHDTEGRLEAWKEYHRLKARLDSAQLDDKVSALRWKGWSSNEDELDLLHESDTVWSVGGPGFRAFVLSDKEASALMDLRELALLVLYGDDPQGVIDLAHLAVNGKRP